MTDTDERTAVYQRLQDAIEACARIEGAEGVLTDWTAVYATQRYDDDGDALTQIGRLTPIVGGGVPYHRVVGLLDYALTRCRAEVARERDI
ncbi:MAG TPA: hypothetical protein VK599_05825 [Streptosporangiaceae bacterium]|nr:hypothetical protein [Streptosporangiaceae bacterium]